MLVFAFDRDWTVDVNPHPNREAVTLSWIRQVAHDTEHEVYAIGNQRLADEADIPGIVDVVERHPDDRDDWHGEPLSNGRYETFPSRRERLALIEDLYPDADEYIVVDDIDLSDVDGWTHYHAWEFVPAVEAGDIHPGLPGIRDGVSDGGLPVTAGIESPNASALAAFLEENDDYGFELTYDDDEIERTQVLHNVSIITRTIERPAAAPAVECTPVRAGADEFSVRVDAIQNLAIVEPPHTLYTADAESVDEEAIGLRRLAEANPDEVSVTAVLGRLDRGSQLKPDNQDALRAVRLVAQARPEDCTVAAPILESLLRAEDFGSPTDALATLRLIGEENPDYIVPAADAIVQYLDSDDDIRRFEATRSIALIAEVCPEGAVDGVPLLAANVEDRNVGLPQAIYALSQITHEYPEEIKPVAETLGEVILDETVSDGVRLNAIAALGRICSDYPATGIELIDDIATLFEADNPKLRNNAIGLFADVAKIYTDVVEAHVDEIAALLDSNDNYTRVNASGALSRVAEDFPDSIKPYSETLVDLLSDGVSLVRINACWALGHLKETAAIDPLQECLQDDDGDVRKRADWALHKINGPDQER